ncbi:MAG: hypothetical protein IT377_17115 [Polyangiaceae bacterium]|nr:hypothetical protein [Polyangiaceae bacterium]
MTKSTSWLARGVPWNPLANDPVNMYGMPAAVSSAATLAMTRSGLSLDAIELAEQHVGYAQLVEVRVLGRNSLSSHLANGLAHPTRQPKTLGAPEPALSERLNAKDFGRRVAHAERRIYPQDRYGPRALGQPASARGAGPTLAPAVQTGKLGDDRRDFMVRPRA